ncbi:putative transcription initiation factor IIB [Scheffersomyces coipomensis]|uniref:putative transcription initiation factor IIB n=1 Tax=Scheffersomyces coipomensis TaxID=1788519 RepID=UPI00315C88E4
MDYNFQNASTHKTQIQPFKPNLSVHLICKDCKVSPPNLVDTSEGFCVCGDCGFAIQEGIVDTRAEWRTFANDTDSDVDPNRVGYVGNSFETTALSTSISYNATIGRKGKELMHAQDRLNGKKDSALAAAFTKISAYCDGYQLPRVVHDSAKEVYQLVCDDNSLRGKSQDAVIASSIFLGCRKANMSRTFKEISALTNVQSKDIGKVYKIISKIMQNKTDSDPYNNCYPEETTNNSQTSLTDLIRRICSSLGLNNKVTIAAEHIAQRCKEEDILTGRSPNTIAGASIYMATVVYQVRIPMQSLCLKGGIGPGAIKSACTIIKAEEDKLIDSNWLVKS